MTTDPQASRAADRQPGRGRILVVDDDRLVLATLAHGLAQAGYDVIDADNGDDAILLAREQRPQLALLDIRMEGLTGFDVAAYLREYCQIPFMFLSAFSDDETVRKVKELGAVAYLVKPLDIRQIVPTVEAAFAQIAHAAHAAHAAAPSSAPMPASPRAVQATPRDNALPVVASTVAMAVGVLMHRYSLTRDVALERLQRHARAEGAPLADHAERLLQAVELLANSGQG